jgi:uncharacterized protein YfaT (DUF1175 family)
MRRRSVFFLLLFLSGLALTALAGLMLFGGSLSRPRTLILQVDRTLLPADGLSSATLLLRTADDRRLTPGDVSLNITEGARRARIESVVANGNAIQFRLRVGVQPGPIVVEASGKNISTGRISLTAALDSSDHFADGTPDFLRLDDAADREAFRRWFTFLAEVQAFRRPGELPREINDCAALLRFAYREALREHDSAWVNDLRLPAMPEAHSVQKYAYPFTPLGAGLFRVQPGAFRAEDIPAHAFAQFADAETLQKRNTHFVTRNIAQAEPGDLLFYRQLEQDMPFHAMVFLGPSQLEPGVLRYVVYHTGPLAGGKGEIRRVRVEELLLHPSPRWRPVPGNVNFLGVYRWNILK